MEQATVKRLSELDDRHLDQTVQLFIDGFFKEMGDKLSINLQTLANAVKPSFKKDHYYVCLLDDKVMGLLAVSSNKSRSHAFDKKTIRRGLGFFKGSLIYSILNEELQKPLDLPEKQCNIESVTTGVEARGKGVASKLINHVIDNLDYEEFVLDVIDSNVNAIRLYEKLGFAVYKRKKESFLARMAGMNERLYMKYNRPESSRPGL